MRTPPRDVNPKELTASGPPRMIDCRRMSQARDRTLLLKALAGLAAVGVVVALGLELRRGADGVRPPEPAETEPQEEAAARLAPAPPPPVPIPPPSREGAGPSEAPSEPDEKPADDWTGSALYGPKATTQVVVRDTESWIKLWPMLSAEPLPLLDFETQMVVGIVAGGSPASVRITGIEAEEDGLVVNYSRRPSDAEAAAPSYQYHLKAVPKTALPVRFEEAP